MSAWPPPPDLESIRQLVRDADTEGFIAIHAAPADEYDHEAELLFTAIGKHSTADLTAANILTQIEAIWSRIFDYDEAALANARPALQRLAQQIARFFGPGTEPQTRNSSG
jgi:hypothetical protein